MEGETFVPVVKHLVAAGSIAGRISWADNDIIGVQRILRIQAVQLFQVGCAIDDALDYFKNKRLGYFGQPRSYPGPRGAVCNPGGYDARACAAAADGCSPDGHRRPNSDVHPAAGDRDANANQPTKYRRHFCGQLRANRRDRWTGPAPALWTWNQQPCAPAGDGFGGLPGDRRPAFF